MSPRAMIVSAINGITTHFTFMSKKGEAKEHTLLDSGTTENFMDHSMVKHLRIRTRKLPVPRRIFNVDGTENIAGRLTESCTLRVHKGNQNHLQTFYIITLGADCAILGYPWLRMFNPWVDWEKGRILGPRIWIETCGLRKHREAVWGRVLEAARRDPMWEEGNEVIIMTALVHTSQQWAIEANRQKQNVPMLLAWYQHHTQLFSEEAIRCFPPSQPKDLAV